MTLNETFKQLKALGSAKVRAQNAKSGARDNQFGVSLGDVRALAKRIRTDHPLALSLWETGNVGLIVAAPVAEIVGVGVWYLAGGIACVAMGIAGFFAPALMGIEDDTAEGVASMCVDAPSGR